jgi:hypothetical protein
VEKEKMNSHPTHCGLRDISKQASRQVNNETHNPGKDTSDEADDPQVEQTFLRTK